MKLIKSDRNGTPAVATGNILWLRIGVLAVFSAVMQCAGQGTLHFTFDGPPVQPTGAVHVVQQYSEAGMSFTPLGFGFARAGGGIPQLAENESAYLQAGLTHSLRFNLIGGMVTTVLTTDGIIDGTGPLEDFQTFQFGPQWSGLARVEIPTYGWSLDNLYVSVPEPSTGALVVLGAALLGLRFFKGKR